MGLGGRRGVSSPSPRPPRARCRSPSARRELGEREMLRRGGAAFGQRARPSRPRPLRARPPRPTPGPEPSAAGLDAAHARSGEQPPATRKAQGRERPTPAGPRCPAGLPPVASGRLRARTRSLRGARSPRPGRRGGTASAGQSRLLPTPFLLSVPLWILGRYSSFPFFGLSSQKCESGGGALLTVRAFGDPGLSDPSYLSILQGFYAR